MDASVPSFSPLDENEGADVCIIGAGIAGITTAYLLAKAGLSVVVIDDGEIGGGETGRTTAHLTSALDDRYFEIERLHGEEGARIAAQSHTAAINLIEDIIMREGIDCSFERLDGYLFVPPGESIEVLEREYEAIERIGLRGIEMIARAPLSFFHTGPCLRFSRQAQFHPLKYISGLALAIVRGGGRIYTHTKAVRIEGGSPSLVVTPSLRTILAKSLVVATNTPVNDLVTVHTKQAAYRTYVIGAEIPAGSVTKALYWDTADPYHYVRLQSRGVLRGLGKDILIVGGEDHKTGQADDAGMRFANLEAWMRERFPMAGDIAYLWSGQVMEPVDSLAFIGRNPGDNPNVYIATGDSGNGMTHGTIAGLLIRDLIMGQENVWSKLYDPARISLKAGKEFLRENINVAAQYTDWATGGEVNSASEIARGAGAIIRRGLKKVAAYRDEDGSVHEFSAACPHLGCVVAWNSKEKSWDCPCHGSRFDPFGKVINGPALCNLTPVEEVKRSTAKVTARR
jgi:glycine/D-amino acid oxidase-like deaminating enzyme/nitrite reductase/ring-hydroxylating ferredoxin subunit